MGCLLLIVGVALMVWTLAFTQLFDKQSIAVIAFMQMLSLPLGIGSFVILFKVWREKKLRNIWLSAGAFFAIVFFLKDTWTLAIMKFLRIPEKSSLAWFHTPALLLVASFWIAYLIWAAIVRDKMSKTLKRGVNIRPLKILEGEKAIVVGSFAPNILPKDVQGFAAATAGTPISLPTPLLTRGISIIGDPGSGKSRLMQLLHDGIYRQFPEMPVLIHDPKGEWLRTYFNPATDLVFAPNDKRGVHWDIFSDIKSNPQLLSGIVAAAVSQHHGDKGENAYWVSSASALIQEQLETASDMMAFRDGLLKWRDAHSNDKTALSIFSSARPAIKDIARIALTEGAGGKKTMEQFLKHRGRIFLLNSPAQTAEQSGAFAVFLSAFALSCLSLADTSAPRAFIIIDEALTFHFAPALEEILTAQARSKGLITMAGAQWVPQDGRRLLTRAEFIFGMKVGDLGTGKILAAKCGDLVFDEETTSATKTGMAGRSSSTSSQQERSRQMMPPEYFRSLPARSFILLHEAGFAPGITAEVKGEQQGHIAAFEYQQQPLVSEYMKAL